MSEVPKPEPAASADEPSPSELVRVLQRQLEQMTAVMERQTAIIDRLLGAPGLPVALPAPAAVAAPAPVDTLTIANVWTPYFATLGTAQWVRNVEILMQRPLRHFAPSLAPKRFRAARYRYEIHAGPDMLVSALRPHHWTAFRAWLVARCPEVGVTTRNLMLTRAQAMLNWAVREELITTNVLARVELEPRKPRRETTITPEQLDAIIAAEPSPVFRAYMLVASDSGMRFAEVRTLRWDQIDFETGKVALSWTTTKSKKSRIARLSPRAMAAAQALPRTCEFVFASPRGGRPYSTKNIWLWFRRAVAAAGIQAAPGDGRVHFHDATRHTFATRLHEAGATLKEVQVSLGHASVQTTGLYLHTDEEALDKAHARLHAARRRGPKHKPQSP